MFEDNTAQPEKEAGLPKSEAEPDNPVVSAIHQASAEENDSPSVAGSGALPWYLDMKYFWKQNKSGNGSHLAPQATFIDDVLTEGDRVVLLAAKDFTDKKSTDLELAKAELKAAQDIIETRKAFDTAGVAAQRIIRNYLKECVLARKIAGASEVSAQHRIINARLTGQDEEKVKSTDWFKSDLENRDRWAFQACYYEFIASALADGEVIIDLRAQIVSGVGRLLYDDAIQATNRLRNPSPVSQEQRASVDMTSIRAATA